MKRRIVIFVSFIIILGLVSFIFYVHLSKERNYEMYKVLPVFAFKTLHNKFQNTSKLSNYKGYVVQIFNPGCEVCQQEATDYFNHNDSLKNICFLMLSSDTLPRIYDFAVKQKLYNLDNFIFGHLDDIALENIFGTVSIPAHFIYNSKKELVNKTKYVDSSFLLNYFKD